jgi:long-chain acyl-CoA synthetase
MGASQSELIYSIPVTKNQRPGETEVYRNPSSKDELLSSPDPDITNLQELLITSATKYQKNKCLGSRNPENFNVYEFKDYHTCLSIAQKFGRGLVALDLCPAVNEYNDLELKFLGIYSKNSEKYVLADWACIFFGIVSVSMYDTLGPKTISHILNHTSMTTVCTTVSSIDNILDEPNTGKLKNLIIFEDLVANDNFSVEQLQSLKDRAKERGFQIFDFSGIVAAGQAKPEIPFATVFPDSIYTFSYTSGTLSVPKAVMITHLNVLSSVGSVGYSDFNIGEDDVHLSYLPMAHIFERFCIAAAFTLGA